jgi:hypothetical protein
MDYLIYLLKCFFVPNEKCIGIKSYHFNKKRVEKNEKILWRENLFIFEQKIKIILHRLRSSSNYNYH